MVIGVQWVLTDGTGGIAGVLGDVAVVVVAVGHFGFKMWLLCCAVDEDEDNVGGESVVTVSLGEDKGIKCEQTTWCH